MKFSELISKLHAASQPHMLMHIDIRSDCELKIGRASCRERV